MDFVGILLGLLIFCVVIWLGVAGVLVWGVSRLIGAISQRLLGKRKNVGHVSAPPPPHRVQATANSANNTTQPRPAPTPAAHARSYEYLDVDNGATAESIIKVMRSYEQERVVGFYAGEVINALNMAELRKKSLMSEIDSKFSRRSISWDHFASTATEALDAILRNCALLANRVQSFDVEDYERMERFYRTGGEARNGKQNPARLQRWDLLRETKTEMDDLRSANDGLLLELGKLSSELGKISSNDSTEESSRIADEVRRLAEETKYYR